MLFLLSQSCRLVFVLYVPGWGPGSHGPGRGGKQPGGSFSFRGEGCSKWDVGMVGCFGKISSLF